jgi:hypothetical protein
MLIGGFLFVLGAVAALGVIASVIVLWGIALPLMFGAAGFFLVFIGLLSTDPIKDGGLFYVFAVVCFIIANSIFQSWKGRL